MRARALLIALTAVAVLGCSKEKPASAKGSIVFVDQGGPIILDVTDLTLKQDDNKLFLKFKLTGPDGEGECDLEGYQLDGEFGPYQMGAGGCSIKAGGATFTVPPGTGQATYQEGTIALSLKGNVLKDARKGAPYELTFEGTH